jgi:hypothetical protein
MYPFRESVRWKKSTDGTEDDGPFCPTCLASKKVLEHPICLSSGSAIPYTAVPSRSVELPARITDAAHDAIDYGFVVAPKSVLYPKSRLFSQTFR